MELHETACEHVVACEHGDVVAVRLVKRRGAAAHAGAVYDIIVDERGRVQQFDGRGKMQDLTGACAA